MIPIAQHRGLRVLFGLACFVIVVAGCKLGDELIKPLLVAAFFSVLCIPPMRLLVARGLPQWLAIVAVVGIALVVLLGLVALIGNSVAGFQSRIPIYQERLNELVGAAETWLWSLGFDVSVNDLVTKALARIDSTDVVNAAGSFGSEITDVILNAVVILIIMVFILVEANSFSAKLRWAKGDPNADLSGYETATASIKSYIAVKSVVSAATAVLASLLCWLFSVDLPLLWGLMSFLLNFIPNVGSLIAAVPPILLALLLHGGGTALMVAAGYIGIEIVMANVIEPRMMGRRVGLSALVVLLSLIFWNWVWGPVGMFLSVPLTVIVKILLENSDDFRSVAIFLGPGDESPVVPNREQSAAKSS